MEDHLEMDARVDVKKRRLDPTVSTATLAKPIIKRQELHVAHRNGITDDVLDGKREVDLVLDLNTICQRWRQLHLLEDHIVHQRIIDLSTVDNPLRFSN